MPSITEMLEEILDVSTGLGVMLLPLLLLVVPGLVLVVVPAIVLMAPLALVTVLLAAPVLLIRALRQPTR